LVSDKAPKPKLIPKAPTLPEPVPEPKTDKVISIPEHKPPAIDFKPPVVRVKPLPMPDDIKKDHKCIEFLFLETPVNLCFDPNFQSKPVMHFNKKSISKFWQNMSLTDHKGFVQHVLKLKKEMKLNDWGFHFLLYKSGEKIYDGNRNMSLLFVWFISSKAGYESRVGYKSDQIYLLMPSQNTLYSIPFLTIKGKRYYAQYFDQQPVKFKKIFSYKGEYPGADRLMDYSFKDSPLIAMSSEKRDIRFHCNGKDYSFPIYFNRNLIHFYRYYPQTELQLYFTAAMPKETEADILNNLKPAINGLSEKEAADVLLRFVQTVFAYKTDADQFGREKFMFPAETIYYPYSDCEDRSFLFVWLVENLLELEAVGLDYPGHVATGVKFNSDIDGDHVIWEETKYTVCDPTYINAEAGMAMPDFKNIKPEIIKKGG
ncbi:MAG: hypothetical protein JRF40_12050, partial [Deltaproteobacteria bacterium]|nr:hypothetical protein [Deltaproteobacteria bacterium]